MTNKNKQSLATLMNEAVKIKETNKDMFISFSVHMFHKGNISVNFGAIGKSGKCFTSKDLFIKEFTTASILNNFNNVTERAKNFKNGEEK